MKRIAVIGDRNVSRNENYYAAVEACGANTIMLKHYDKTDIIKDVDGIVLPGGVDVNPALYGEENTDSRDIDGELDRLELEVIREAVKYKKPILGICRGHQILNVFLGGSLIQNLERCDIHACMDGKDRVHAGKVLKDSFIYDIYGQERIRTNSAHHQAVKKLGEGLRAVQFSDDGVIEAFCHTELPIYGVQWHPERMCLKNARPDTVNGLEVFAFFINNVI